VHKEQARYLSRRAAKCKSDQRNGSFDCRQQKQAKLAKELDSMHARGSKALQMGGIVAAGGAAAAYALANPIKQAMTFDERLAHMSNTAFRERDVAGRKFGMNELRTAIDKAQQGGGGTREGAAEALDSMIASGAMSPAQAVSMLPHVTKAASAANADPTQLANIGIRAMQTFKIKSEDMPNVLNMALAAGQAGGFELKDMSKWLPQQMAAATMSGLSGKEGFAKLAALNQAAAITAGSKDEAGNNVVNLLSKINSQDTRRCQKAWHQPARILAKKTRTRCRQCGCIW
jgi:TP901 family phage tail tape measure protein